MAKKSTKKSKAELNETGRRIDNDRRNNEGKPVSERRKTNRRRQIDPTTCEREYTDAEIEFMQALDEYKRQSGRMFPTCSEILEVIQKLGYQKQQMPAGICCQEQIANEASVELSN
ncbi:MAG: hypothetical protein ACR2NP_13320 [Pirellulaceae bacterium]